MADQKQTLSPNQEKPFKKTQKSNQFIWVILGIMAILLIWLLSSWIYK